MKKKAIVQAVHVTKFFLGHAGYFHDGEHLKKLYNVWFKTDAGHIDHIDFERIKQAMGWLRRPCESRLNTLLQGKTIDMTGNITDQLIRILKK